MTLRKLTLAAGIALGAGGAAADDTKFSTHLHAKFHHSACLTCHQFFTRNIAGTGKRGIGWTHHIANKNRNCVECHTAEVTGFKHAEEWFADPNIDYSGMGPKETCEFVKTTLNGKYSTQEMMLKHLLTDPRILWAIEGGQEKVGGLPGGKKRELIPGNFDEWRAQVTAWVGGGMKCE